MTERLGIIDLGSNSARLIVMHIYHNGAYNLVYHQKEAVRLSEGMDKDLVLQPEAMRRAIHTLKTFAHMCQLFKVNQIIAVATAAVRNAKNGTDFVELVKQEANISLEVIPGEEEARIGAIAVANTLNISDALLFDLGGGSTELTLLRNHRPVRMVSLPFGAVTLTEKFGTQEKLNDTTYHKLKEFIREHLDKLPWLKNLDLPLVGIGGTARNLAKMDQKRKKYPLPKVHNYRMSSLSLDNLWKTLSKTSQAQRKKIPGLNSDRSDIILAGTVLVKELCQKAGGDTFIVSGCGLREGLFMQYYMHREGIDDIFPDILMHSTRNMLLFYKGNSIHAYHVAYLSQILFDDWKNYLDLSDRDGVLLKVAAFLHDIGITINYYNHARHSTYLVENARLFGLTHREQMLCAIISGWHHGINLKYASRLYHEFLDETDWQKARRIALILAIAESLDATQMGVIQKIHTTISDKFVHILLKAQNSASIERAEVQKHAKWLKKEFGRCLAVE